MAIIARTLCVFLVVSYGLLGMFNPAECHDKPKTYTGLLGGMAGVEPATEEVQQICDQVKPQVEQQTGRKFKTFSAKSFATQVVAGINYFIKVFVGGDPPEMVHLRVYQGFGNETELAGVRMDKKLGDPLEYF